MTHTLPKSKMRLLFGALLCGAPLGELGAVLPGSDTNGTLSEAEWLQYANGGAHTAMATGTAGLYINGVKPPVRVAGNLLAPLQQVFAAIVPATSTSPHIADGIDRVSYLIDYAPSTGSLYGDLSAVNLEIGGMANRADPIQQNVIHAYETLTGRSTVDTDLHTALANVNQALGPTTTGDEDDEDADDISISANVIGTYNLVTNAAATALPTGTADSPSLKTALETVVREKIAVSARTPGYTGTVQGDLDVVIKRTIAVDTTMAKPGTAQLYHTGSVQGDVEACLQRWADRGKGRYTSLWDLVNNTA